MALSDSITALEGKFTILGKIQFRGEKRITSAPKRAMS